jgi:JAB domain-containing protein similar to deubiquitination enzymes
MSQRWRIVLSRGVATLGYLRYAASLALLASSSQCSLAGMAGPWPLIRSASPGCHRYRATISGNLQRCAEHRHQPRAERYGPVEGLKDFFSYLTGVRGSPQHYVGEWHSHPMGGAHPSSTDVNSGMDIARDEDVPCNEIISLILGNINSSTPDLSVSVYSASNDAIMLSRVHDPDQA